MVVIKAVRNGQAVVVGTFGRTRLRPTFTLGSAGASLSQTSPPPSVAFACQFRAGCYSDKFKRQVCAKSEGAQWACNAVCAERNLCWATRFVAAVRRNTWAALAAKSRGLVGARLSRTSNAFKSSKRE